MNCKQIDLLTYSTGICSDQLKGSVESHIAECESCRIKLEQIRNEQTSFLESMPFESINLEPKPAKPAIQFPKFVSSIAAMLVLALVVGRYVNKPAYESASVSLKGSVGFHLLSENPDGSIGERAEPIYFPQERIQACYTLTDSAYVAIFSVDSSGSVSTYFPSGSTSSEQVSAGVMVPIPNSIRLDSYVGKENYCMIVTKNPLNVDSVATLVGKSVAAKRSPLITLAKGDTMLVRTIEKRGSR